MAAAAIAGGTALNVYGKIEAGRQQRKALNEQADNLELQASETIARADINKKATIKSSKQFAETQKAGFAKGGAEVSAGTSLKVLEDTASKLAEQLINLDRETRFNVEQLRRGATSARRAGKQAQKAALIGAGGSILSGAGQAKTAFSAPVAAKKGSE